MKKTGKCKDCGKCERLYRRVLVGYSCDRKYYCTEKKEIIDRASSCDKWTRKGRKVDLSKVRFDNVEADLTFIYKRLGEDR